ncbi:hypothetical protein PYCC9005_005664 [Savitreella phatthalungensis]
MGAGAMYVLLNGLRVLMVSALALSAFASCVVIGGMRSDVQTYFFNILASAYRCVVCILLIMVEVPPKKVSQYVTRHLAILGDGHSLVWLGITGCVLAASLLADLRLSPLTDLPTAWHSVIFAAGIVFGLISLVYCAMPVVLWGWPSGDDRRLRREGAAGEKKQPPLPLVTAKHRASSSVYMPNTYLS